MDDDETEIEITPLDFLEAVYLNPNLPLNTRMRAAIESAPYKHPKLSAHAHGHFDGTSFAAQLERAIERSGVKPLPLPPPAVIEHEPSPTVSPEEMKRPFSRYRRY